jgi:phosphoglycerol transferase MdoB-like AlkP superfamily enzyme
MRSFLKYSKPFIYLTGFYLIVCTLLRIILLSDAQVRSSFHLIDFVYTIVGGLVPNLLVFLLLSIPLWLYLLFLSENKFKKPYGYFILSGLMFLLLYILLSNNPIKAYGSVLMDIVGVFLLIKILLFAWMLWHPTARLSIRKWLYGLTLFIYIGAILINALSEYFFWKEFGARYNFIAVDYLIYTNEVIGNILQSYPVVPLFMVLGIFALFITIFIYRKTFDYLTLLPAFRTKLSLLIALMAGCLLAIWILPIYAKADNTSNLYVSELGADGPYKFYIAFKDNELSYTKFYPTIKQDSATAILSRRLGWQMPSIRKQGWGKMMQDSSAELHKNIVLITVESLSADYLAHYGNTDHLTPFLDSLADKSLVFTQLYAAGNRTVRGLEALTLCIPPSPGESIIKRKDNKNKFTTGSILKQKGYTVQFLYGGYSYFDNMQDFFAGNGYQVIDRSSLSPSEISFANIWGVCDQDMAAKLLDVLNQDAGSGKPFFAHWMTVSNHRPFTYPDGKIAIPGDAKSRKGGVMYTDYALKQFFSRAAKQPWFDNTVFIIVADHCASSSGKVALPLEKYRIPCMVYSRGFIAPQKVTTLMSQIDIMPTVFSLLHLRYQSKFIGQNVLSRTYQPRAVMATYQDLGYLQDSTLTILSPVRQIKAYHVSVASQKERLPRGFISNFDEIPTQLVADSLINTAISYYQTTSWLLQHRLYQKQQVTVLSKKSKN